MTFDGCYFHHVRDYGIFPSNFGLGAGSINLVVKNCRFDATSKFEIRGRGANVQVESSVFTRACQGNNGDGENSAVAINNQDGHSPTGSVKNCLFVNCGSGFAQRAYYGGVNIHNGDLLTVERCTFVACLSGVGAGSGGPGTLNVSKSIFHQIGYNVSPSVDASGITLTNGSPELINGLYPACTNEASLAKFGATKWSGVFNRYNDNDAKIIIDNCLVGDVASEDTRSWDDALAASEVTGCRLYCGFDTHFEGTNTVTRGTPVFVNTDPDAPNAFQLAAGSPGQGLGADLAPVFEPKLLISLAGNKVTISWSQPLWMKGYALKSTTSLSNPHWTTVAGVANNIVSLTVGSEPQFFAVWKQ